MLAGKSKNRAVGAGGVKGKGDGKDDEDDAEKGKLRGALVSSSLGCILFHYFYQFLPISTNFDITAVTASDCWSTLKRFTVTPYHTETTNH